MLTQVDVDGTTARELVQLTQVDVDGSTVRDLKSLWQNDSTGTPRQIWGSMSVEISPTFLTATGYNPGTATPTTEFATATITGGVAPYTYAWSADGSFTTLNPTGVSTNFRSPAVAAGDSATGFAYLTVTDANLTPAIAEPVSIFSTNAYSPI